MLMEQDNCGLLLIDVQEKLAPWVRDTKTMLEHCDWLMRLAKDRGIPTLISEQYTRGLGPTVAPLDTFSSTENTFEKVHFSCWRDEQFKSKFLSMNKKQWVLIGIEAHVCVLQTALDLLQAGYQVFVVVDAVSSRFEADYHFGLKRMKQAGAELVTREMVFFEWLEQAGTEQFKQLSKAYLKKE